MSVPLHPTASPEDRLNLIEAVLFELLNRATPPDAIPAVSRRIAERAPVVGAEQVESRLRAFLPAVVAP